MKSESIQNSEQEKKGKQPKIKKYEDLKKKPQIDQEEQKIEVLNISILFLHDFVVSLLKVKKTSTQITKPSKILQKKLKKERNMLSKNGNI